MRIAKPTYLMRLLQTQDALLSTLLFTTVCTTFWLLGHVSTEEATHHLHVSLFVFVAAISASLASQPRLHRQSFRSLTKFAARYTGIVGLALLAFVYVGGLEFINGAVVGAFIISLPAVLVLNRLFLRWWYLNGFRESRSNYLRVLMIGCGNRARRLAEAYKADSEWGIEIVGVLDPHPLHGGLVNGGPIIGKVEGIHAFLARQVVDEVIICLPRSMLKDEIQEIVDACVEEAVCVKLLADSYDIKAKAVKLERIGSHPVLSFEPVSQAVGSLMVKRIVDLAATLTLLALLAPLFALIAVAIKLDSKGPVFFRQQRVGLNKRLFTMLKFRSMVVDAEERLGEIEHLNEGSGPIFKMRHDPRTTRVGRLLRRTSFDELPQLINVLRGEMSLIGPRPMSLRDVSRFSLGIQRRRFSVLPGLACLREISGRSRLSFDRWLELDLKYIEEWSLWLDLRILLKLIPAVLRGDGAS